MSGENICPLPPPTTPIQSLANKTYKAAVVNSRTEVNDPKKAERQKAYTDAKQDLHDATVGVKNQAQCKAAVMFIEAARSKFDNDEDGECRNITHEELLKVQERDPSIQPADLQEAISRRAKACDTLGSSTASRSVSKPS